MLPLIDNKVTVEGLQEQIGALKEFMPDLNKRLLKAVRAANTVVRNDVKPRVMTFTGATKKTIRSTVRSKQFGNVSGKTGASKDRVHVFRLMQSGRGGGKMPPVSAFMEWVERKGLDTSDGGTRATAFRVAKAASKKGTFGIQIMRPVLIKQKDKIRKIIQAAINEVLNALKVGK